MASFFNVFQYKIFTIIAKDITYKIRKKVLLHLEKISMQEYEGISIGDINSRLVTDINTLDQFISLSISKLIIAILSILGIGIVLFLINPILALIIMVFNPITIYFTFFLSKLVSKLKKEENNAMSFFASSLVETLEVFPELRSNNKEKIYFSKILTKAKIVKKMAIDFSYKSEGAKFLSFFIFLMGFEFFRGAGVLSVHFSDLSIGLMFAVFSYLWLMMGPIQELLNIQYTYNNAKVALERINALFRLKQEVKYQNKINPFSNKNNISIELRNIYFSYNSENKILENINLNIKEGEKVALVGASGSGKTTLAKLIVGFYYPNNGDIYFDGINIKDIGLNIVRENIFLVLQAPMLLNDTIKNNLILGKNISDNEIYEALRITQLEELVDSLDGGLSSLVGINGIKLSGGQRQRLALARMILSNPKIVILDESTSALDGNTESNLFKGLKEFLKDKTVIIIAHRKNTIKQADKVYELRDHKLSLVPSIVS